MAGCGSGASSPLASRDWIAGRAGRAEQNGQVIVQTLHAEEPAIRFALTHDYDGFAAGELALRKEIGYPPFSRMVRFIEPVAEIATVLPQIDILVAPSLWEACPLLPMEAMVLAGRKDIRDRFDLVDGAAIAAIVAVLVLVTVWRSFTF